MSNATELGLEAAVAPIAAEDQTIIAPAQTGEEIAMQEAVNRPAHFEGETIAVTTEVAETDETTRQPVKTEAEGTTGFGQSFEEAEMQDAVNRSLAESNATASTEADLTDPTEKQAIKQNALADLIEHTLRRQPVEAKLVKIRTYTDKTEKGETARAREAGLIVSLPGRFKAFLPKSKLPRGVRPADFKTVSKDGAAAADTMKVMILELDYEVTPPNIVVSRIDALTQEQQQFAASLVVNSEIKGTIARSQPYGYFVKIGPMDGLLHVSQIPVGQELIPGDEISMRVLRVDMEKLHVDLSLLPEGSNSSRSRSPARRSARAGGSIVVKGDEVVVTGSNGAIKSFEELALVIANVAGSETR